jgi:hypothetical protein
MNRTIPTILAALVFAGCSHEMADEADVGSSEESQTFGAGGIPLAPAQRVDPGDIVEVRTSEEPAACGAAGAVHADLATLKAECLEDDVGGVHGVVISQSTPYIVATGLCRAKISCLFNVSND